MANICVIASWPWLPIKSADGSLNVAPELAPPAGEGVAGVSEAGALARVGAEGVIGAGADGAAAGVWDEEAAEAEGAAFGYIELSGHRITHMSRLKEHTLDTMHTMKPFSSMLYDSTVLSSCRILPVGGVGLS